MLEDTIITGGLTPDNKDITQLTKAIEALIAVQTKALAAQITTQTDYLNLSTPIGTIAIFAMSALPPNYLLCNGAAVSRTAYSQLFAAIGTIWGAGDQVATFNVPNLETRFLRNA